MSELEGVWDVKRLSGVLPPLVGVRKQIRGASGSTKVGRLPGVPFDVVGLSLRYRPPFTGFVDQLEPAGDGYRGKATFQGREFGKFELRRHNVEEGRMASEQLKEQLVKHIDEAYAMEQNVLRMLDSMIESTEDPEIKGELREHKVETERHAERMQERLEANGASPSMVKEAGGVLGALMKSVVDMARGEKAGRNAPTGTRPSTWRSRATSCSSGSPRRPATRRPPRRPARTARRRRRWRRNWNHTGTSSPSSPSRKTASPSKTQGQS